jgi:hypothetical protein
MSVDVAVENKQEDNVFAVVADSYNFVHQRTQKTLIEIKV